MFIDTEMANIKTKDKIIKLKKWFSSSLPEALGLIPGTPIAAHNCL